MNILHMTLSYLMMTKDLGKVDYLFIAITPNSTLIRSGSTWLGTIYRQIEQTMYAKNDWC